MKLSRADAVNLNNILAVAQLAGVQEMVLDDGLMSGINQGNCIMVARQGVPKPGVKIGIGNVETLRTRLDLFAAKEDLAINVSASDYGEAKQLEIVSGKNKAQYRCRGTAMIKAPKGLDDTVVAIVTMSADELSMFMRSIRAMGTKQVNLILKSDKTVFFSTNDSTNDKFEVGLEKEYEQVEDVDGTMVHSYNTVYLAPLMKAAASDEGLSFTVGECGTIAMIVRDYEIYVTSNIEMETEDND